MKDPYTRNKECDRDITIKFGRPLWGESSLSSEDDEGTRVLITPMETPGLWRIDKIRKGEL